MQGVFHILQRTDDMVRCRLDTFQQTDLFVGEQGRCPAAFGGFRYGELIDASPDTFYKEHGARLQSCRDGEGHNHSGNRRMDSGV